MSIVNDKPSHTSNLFNKSIHFQSNRTHGLKDYTKGYFGSTVNETVGNFFRNKFYLPLLKFYEETDTTQHVEAQDPHFFEKSTLKYMKLFTKMLKNELPTIDPTFSHFDEIRKNFNIHDIPVTIDGQAKKIILNVRIVESRNFGEDKKGLRFVLFGFNENFEEKCGQVSRWNPKSLEEIAQVPLELIHALKENAELNSLVCFSLGALTLEALKNCREDVLPKNIIINRGLTSIRKVSPAVLPYPLSSIVYHICSRWHLDADPESTFLEYLEKNPGIAAQKRVVLIKASLDRYFSGRSDYHSHFYSRVKKVVSQAFEGSFSVPYLHPLAHHALRPDWIICHPESGSDTKNFIPIEHSETLADAINNFFCSENQDHTCLIVGGNRDNLDTILYSLTGILNSWVKSNIQ